MFQNLQSPVDESLASRNLVANTLVDSHCHLDFPEFSEDWEDVLLRAKQAGIQRIVTICTRMRDVDAVKKLVARSPMLYYAAGVHPNNTAQEPDISVADITAALDHDRAVAVGETGLDWHYNYAPKDIQFASFQRHLEAALALDLPVVVHAREADDDILSALRDGGLGRGLRGVLHCFSSSRHLAEAAVEGGFYISFSGILTFKSAKNLQEIASDLPLDRLLIETDAPYLAPTPHRGKRNEPAFVVHTAEMLASLRGLSLTEMANITTENFDRLFTRAAL